MYNTNPNTMRKGDAMIRRCTTLLLTIALLVCSGCGITGPAKIPSTAVLVVIDTASEKNDSWLIFLDKDLNAVGKRHLPYGNIGNVFTKPFEDDRNVYLFARGMGSNGFGRKVLIINKSTSSIQSFPTRLNKIEAIAANADSIFVATNWNFKSYVGVIDIETSKETIHTLEDCPYVPSMAYDTHLFIACSAPNMIDGNHADESYLYEANSRLDILRKFNTSQYGVAAYNMLPYEGDLYYTNSEDSQARNIQTFVRFSIKERMFTNIDTGHSEPWSLAVYRDQILIGHVYLADRDTHHDHATLTEYDTRTEEITNHSLPIGSCDQIAVIADRLYVMSDRTIGVFNADDMSLIRKVHIPKHNNIYTYVTGIFTLR